MKTARVLLADDHALVRAGIRSLLEKISGTLERAMPKAFFLGDSGFT